MSAWPLVAILAGCTLALGLAMNGHDRVGVAILGAMTVGLGAIVLWLAVKG